MKTEETRLAETKSYLRIEHDDEDALLSLLITAGEEYLFNAGVKRTDSRLFDLALMLYVGMHYENRDASQKTEGFSYALQSIILQIKGS